MNSKLHWENIYKSKEIDGVSWFQETPTDSLNLIKRFSNNKKDKIIDVGCGKGFLVDNLIDSNYRNITLVDISANALEEVKTRVKNENVNYIESNVLDFSIDSKFDIWHDRAVFHFITDKKGIEKYISLCNKYVNKEGVLIIGAFAEDGPLKCSGLEIKRYSIKNLETLFSENFELVEGYKMSHGTPFNTEQKFTFCVFRKIY